MKKTISIILSLCILLSFTAISFAKDASEKTGKKNLQEMRKLIKDIATGSDELVGEGSEFHWNDEVINTESDGEVSIKWGSGGWNHTHQYLAARAMVILENDKGTTVANKLMQYGTTIMENADWPDDNERDLPFAFMGHFVNQEGKNYMGYTSPTAKTRANYWAGLAVSNYSSNKTYSMQCLGRAIHYLSDAGEPHHAQNLTVIGSDHADFETWVDTNRFSFNDSSSNLYNYYFGSSWSDKVNNMVIHLVNNANNIEFEELETMPNNFIYYIEQSDYSSVASYTLSETQETLAAFLYRFLQEVGEV